MDTTVTAIGSVVVAELRAAGYMESTIGQYKKTIKALTCFAEGRDGSYMPSLGASFASMTISPRTGRFSAQRSFDYRRLVSVFDAYVATGRVELSCRKRGGGGTRPASSEFTALAAAWDADMDDRDLAPATRDAYDRVARAYLTQPSQAGRPTRHGCLMHQGLEQDAALATGCSACSRPSTKTQDQRQSLEHQGTLGLDQSVLISPIVNSRRDVSIPRRQTEPNKSRPNGVPGCVAAQENVRGSA